MANASFPLLQSTNVRAGGLAVNLRLGLTFCLLCNCVEAPDSDDAERHEMGKSSGDRMASQSGGWEAASGVWKRFHDSQLASPVC